MTNEEFQKAVLDELRSINSRIGNIEERQKSMETRQDEIYEVVIAIEYSNQVGRSELDNQNIKIAKLEGKFKKVAKAYNENVDIDNASNL